MKFNVEHSKLFANVDSQVSKAIEKSLMELPQALEEVLCLEGHPISAWEMIQEACKQILQLRAEVARYDSDRKNEPKPCINYRKIADRIEEDLSAIFKCRYVPRAYAYQIMFVMYLVSKLVPPIRLSWWEKKFLEDLHIYLETTDTFKGASCRIRWAIILDRMPGQNRLPLDITPITPPLQQLPYPPLGPITIFKDCNFFLLQTNNGCQQFFDEVNNSTFQKAG